MNPLTDEQTKRLETMSLMGKPVRHKEKGGSRGAPGRVMGKVVDEVYIIVHDYKHVLHKIEGDFWGGDKYAFRGGYWTYTADRKNIKWGQFTQFLTQREYKQLLAKAREKGWDIF